MKNGLQNTNESYIRLENKYADILHSIVANILWLSKGGRPDIEPVISFLCTRVTKSTKEEKYKFRRVFQYLKQTIDDKRIMGADSLSQLRTWGNYSYEVQPDLKSHTINGMSFVYVMLHCNSRKQKLNTKYPLRPKHLV